MKQYGKIVGGVIVQKQPQQEDGFIEIPANAVCGQVDNGDGTFSNPVPTQDTINANRELEIDKRLVQIDMISVRALRGNMASQGRLDDVTQIEALELEAESLRLEKSNL